MLNSAKIGLGSCTLHLSEEVDSCCAYKKRGCSKITSSQDLRGPGEEVVGGWGVASTIATVSVGNRLRVGQVGEGKVKAGQVRAEQVGNWTSWRRLVNQGAS